jgi:hypothetical protein
MGNISNEWTRREWLQATAAGVTQAAMVAGSSYEYLRTLA